MTHLRLRAYGKINLGLDVTGIREDGYHEVRMIMQTVRLYDSIELYRSQKPGIRLETNLYYLPVNEQNLAYKAAKRIHGKRIYNFRPAGIIIIYSYKVIQLGNFSVCYGRKVKALQKVYIFAVFVVILKGKRFAYGFSHFILGLSRR